MRQPKMVIVGAGLVGGTAALVSAVAIPSAQIVIIDAYISALFPLSLSLMVAAGVPAFAAAIGLGVLSNVYGCLTQYGIGSGPVMYGAGYVTQAEWWRAGFLMSVFYLIVWLTIGPLWWKMLGHI